MLALSLSRTSSSRPGTGTLPSTQSLEPFLNPKVKVTLFLLTSQRYTLTNKCYNGVVYPCQCLQIGFLLRCQKFNCKKPFSSANNQIPGSRAACPPTPPQKSPSMGLKHRHVPPRLIYLLLLRIYFHATLPCPK